MAELMRQLAILPGPPNSRCVVGGLVARNLRWLVAIQLYMNEFLLEGLERGNKSRMLTLQKQRLGDLFAALSVSHEAECNRNALAGQKTIVILVRDCPHFSQNGGGELGAVEDTDCDVAGDCAPPLGVAFLEYLAGQSHLCLRRNKIAGHFAQNLRGRCDDQAGSMWGRTTA
jgi:hypothetical protein